MLTLLEQLDKGTLWHSPGGIHPPELKSISNKQKIGRLPLANEYIIPIPQVGELATLTVNVGDHVLKGQCLTKGSGFTYLPVHAPTSGTVIAIEPRTSNHASGLSVLSCVIETDGQDTWCETTASVASELSNPVILDKIKQAGIAGMGGAAFPSHIKLNPASEIDLVIINGVECEPYITADDRLMQEHAKQILAGIAIINQLLTPKRIIIAIEDNKPMAINAMQAAIAQSTLDGDIIRVTVIPTKYPSGGEKQLIQIITGKEVPSGTIPAQLGVVVHNVGTAFAINQAVTEGKPLIERVVTLTGEQVNQPGNYWLAIGTPIEHALSHVGFDAHAQQTLIVGGPMMGYAINNLHVPILKGSNCILAPSQQEIAPSVPEQACIRCGECAVACPALLLPQQLFWHAKAQEFDKAASFNLQDCIECGCCSYVCPSDIPLVEYYRVAKSALKNAEEEKRQAEAAKVRFEARLKRLEDEKIAREEKAKQAAAKRKQSMKSGDKDAVAAALARVAAKKEASKVPAPTTDKPAKSDAVAAAVARAKAKKAAQQAMQQPETTSQSNDSDTNNVSQQDKIAAAVARAKAKKAAQKSAQVSDSVATNDTDAPVDDKKAKIAAAVARAKAKKAAKQTGEKPLSSEQSLPTVDQVETASPQSAAEIPQSAAEIKKAKIAAAVAKAKAKKAASESAATPTSERPSSDNQSADNQSPAQVDFEAEVTSNSINTANNTTNHKESGSEQPISAADIKKAKIAAAVAKAKAKKTASLASTNPQTTSPNTDTQDSKQPPQVLDVAQPNTDVISDNKDNIVEQPQSAADIKKAKIAAAVAKAKAKKLAKQQED
ncbi:electron transport complex subunit RsxC [Shewanella maritima]|uniref:electron transport complex subunit RsxC n=1 Tax=Shewanella maritima TaxID=2520507 RepID=UPI003736575E